MNRTLLHFFFHSLIMLASSTLLAQPPNNDCSDAIEVFINEAVNYTTIDATTDGPFHPNAPCPSSASDSIFSDIWFYYEATFTGSVIWDLCDSADFDTRVAAYKANATCPLSDSDLLNCNEDGPAACENFESQLIFPVEDGSVYFLRLGGFGDAEPGETGSGVFTIREAPSGPANDFCSSATVVSLGTGQTVNSLNASTDGPAHPGNGSCFGFNDETVQNDIWFSFTAPNSGTVEWSTCDMVAFDSRMAVYGPNATCPVADGDLYACNDDGSGCLNFTSKVIFDVEQNSTYLLRLGGFGGDMGQGTFDLLEVTPPVVPANDRCENFDSIYILTEAQANNFDTVFTGTTVNATFNIGSFVFPYAQCFAGNVTSGEFADVYYKFNNQGLDSLEVIFFRTSDDGEFYVEIFEDCTTPVDTSVISLPCMFVSVDDGLVRFDIGGLSTVPKDYFIRVTTRITTQLPGDFYLQLVGDIIVDDKEPDLLGSMQLFPNPANEKMYLNFVLDKAVPLEITLVNLLGQRMLKENQPSLGVGHHSLKFDIRNFQPGVYFLTISSDTYENSYRFIKQ